MLSAVRGAAPRGAQLEAFLNTPCNHMARLIRDLCEPSAVRENLKDVLKFIKDVRRPDPSTNHALVLMPSLRGRQMPCKTDSTVDIPLLLPNPYHAHI